MYIVDFNTFLNEAEGFNEMGGTFTLASLSQKNLFTCEIAGQISDGAWENSKPFDHWKPWNDCDVEIGSNIGRTFAVKKDGYNLGSLLDYVGARMLALGAAGVAGWDVQHWSDEQYALEYFFSARSLADIERKCITGDFEEHFQSFIESRGKDSWGKKYADSAEKNKKRLEDTWNAIRSGRYGIRQLKADLTQISKAMKIKK